MDSSLDSSHDSSSEYSSTESITTESPTLDANSVAEVHKSRLKAVWQSPVWQFFVIADNNKYAKCNTCDELVARGGANMKTFNTTNLVNHLKVRHSEKFQKFQIKKDKEAQREVTKSDRMQGRSTQLEGLRQLTLHAAGQKNSHVWGINDPRALHIRRKIGDMIAVDNQPFSVVEDISFIKLLHSLEPRYIIPSRKYF